MKISWNCSHCGRRLKVPSSVLGQRIKCPACGGRQTVPETTEEPQEELIVDETAASVFQEADDLESWQPETVVDYHPRRGRRRVWLWVWLVLLLVLTVVGLVVIPPLLPRDPREVVLQNYLDAIRQGDMQKAAQYGVLEDPPQTTSNRRGRWVQDCPPLTGPFGALADFHAFLTKEYRPQGDLYVKKDLTGAVAGLINKRQEIKGKAEDLFSLEPKPGQDPNERLFDVAENLAKGYESVLDMAIGGAQNQAIAITYDQAVAEWGGKLDPAQKELLEHYRRDRKKWRQLLGRDFESIRERGQFQLDESTWRTALWLPGQSAGEPPKYVQFTLVRFRVGLIDSGWKVWDYRVQ